jgi:CheY-like chemotaxis protein
MSAAAAPKTILLVEDEENDVFFFQRAMSKAGVTTTVHVARDGQEAIDYFRGESKFADRAAFPFPSVVLLDLKLPFVMGLDVLKWIRQQSQLATIVVILSSSREQADIAAAYRLGANGYLVKPAEASKLLDLVKAISDFWLAQNTPPPPPLGGRELGTPPNALSHGQTSSPCPPAADPLLQVRSLVSRRDI